MDDVILKAYDQRHKQAFRIAFDALKEVFPPENTLEYWEKTNERCKDVYNAHIDNPLCRHLMTAVMNYLGDVVKEMEEMKDDNR